MPALRGKTVVSLFFEDSTRTRLSFETAARRLSADVMTFSVSSSSVNKGESLRDTVETIEAMGIDAVVVRHSGVGRALAGGPLAARTLGRSTPATAGTSTPPRPCSTATPSASERQRRGAARPASGRPALDGLRIAIVGDIRHSRVARSDVLAFTALGAQVTLVAPPTLLPPSLAGWPVEVSHDLDAVLPKLDVVYLLRLQKERMTEALLPVPAGVHRHLRADPRTGPAAAPTAP